MSISVGYCLTVRLGCYCELLSIYDRFVLTSKGIDLCNDLCSTIDLNSMLNYCHQHCAYTMVSSTPGQAIEQEPAVESSRHAVPQHATTLPIVSTKTCSTITCHYSTDCEY